MERDLTANWKNVRCHQLPAQSEVCAKRRDSDSGHGRTVLDGVLAARGRSGRARRDVDVSNSWTTRSIYFIQIEPVGIRSDGQKLRVQRDVSEN